MAAEPRLGKMLAQKLNSTGLVGHRWRETAASILCAFRVDLPINRCADAKGLAAVADPEGRDHSPEHAADDKGAGSGSVPCHFDVSWTGLFCGP